MSTPAATLLNAFTKAAAGVMIATTALSTVPGTAEAHTIHTNTGSNTWHYLGQNSLGVKSYASILYTGFQGAPSVTFDRLNLHPNGQRRVQRVEAICNGTGTYRIINGYFQSAPYYSFPRYEINRVCSNAQLWRAQQGPVMPAGFHLGMHIH